ncbi:MAG TPA: DUF4215 domain-containing protein [Nannocystis sp.]|jgi:cysteine-rich repeat protein
MRRPGLLVVLLVGSSCSVSNPLFAVDQDDPIATEGPGPTTQGATSEATSEPGTTTDEPGTGSATQTGDATTDEPDPVCGDGDLDEASEECDDGNQIETDTCLPGCVAARCGDGIVHTNHEACDDGNGDDKDECTNSCALAGCGDGVKQPDEECDDGNKVDDDVCSNTCLTAKCGDGITQKTEMCDDGNDVDDDECIDCVTAVCGDGVVQSGVEQCDDGNDDDYDTCITECKDASCGDGFIQADEMCDDGAMNDETCPDCKLPPVCGDGIISGEESCDYNAQPYKDVGLPVCTKSCQLLGCTLFKNTPEQDFDAVLADTWLTPCTWGAAKTVVVTLLDETRQVVYMAKGPIGGDWTQTNLTAGEIAPTSEFNVTAHQRRVKLQRIMPKDVDIDVLMLSSQDANPGNDQPACYKGLGDGYGLAIFSELLPPQEPKLLVMGVLGGVTNNKRFPMSDGSREISYDDGGMDVCVDTTPFLGALLLSVFP